MLYYMNKRNIIKIVEAKIRKKFEADSSGHDWWHMHRVRKTALVIAKKEKADPFIIELGALLHDISDFKFNNGDHMAGIGEAKRILKSAGADKHTIDQILHIIEHSSFRGAKGKNTMESAEGKIVQDADRLDAIGAIGIARTFAYGGWKERLMYDPKGKAHLHKTFEEYKKHPGASTIHHFYEKLLLLKDRMHTMTGKKMALERHRHMEKFLDQFFAEWNGKR